MVAGSLAILASAFLHAAWNASLKRERDPPAAVVGILAAALLTALAASAAAPGPAFPTRAALLWGLAAGLFEGVYFATLAAALARASYGAVYAIARGGALLAVWPLAVLLLREPATPRGIAGASLVGLGVVLVAASANARASRAGAVLAAACAASIAGYHLAYDLALQRGARPAPLFALALAVALPFAVAASPGGGAGLARLWSGRAAARWCVGGAVCTASFLFFLHGLEATGPALALTLRNTSIVFAQVLALAIGEAVPRRQVAGAVLVTAGAALASWR
jgi:drug/metabolite transporter (DMT)-like permease